MEDFVDVKWHKQIKKKKKKPHASVLGGRGRWPVG